MQEIIKVKQMTKIYSKQTAVEDVSFSVTKGTVFGLLGANGAGKSTTIECILGTKKMDKGEVSILGMNPVKDRKKLFEKVGVQFQESSYQEQITVKELCAVTTSLYAEAGSPTQLLEEFGILDKEKNLVKDLSGGQKQRLSVVLALIANPQVVFLDELTTGLDAKARRQVWNLLSGLKKKGLTILLTSHFIDEVEFLCDEICILKKGKIVFYGTVPAAIEASPYDKFEDAYLWYTDEEGQDENI